MIVYSPQFDIFHRHDDIDDDALTQQLATMLGLPSTEFDAGWMDVECHGDELSAVIKVTHPDYPDIELMYELHGHLVHCAMEMQHILGLSSLTRRLHQHYPDIRATLAAVVLGSDMRGFFDIDEVHGLLSLEEQIVCLRRHMSWYLTQEGCQGVLARLAALTTHQPQAMNILCGVLPYAIRPVERPFYLTALCGHLQNRDVRPFVMASLQRYAHNLVDYAVAQEWWDMLTLLGTLGVQATTDEVVLYF